MPNELSQLRDIQLPDPVSFWPPAFGWWLIVLIAFVLQVTLVMGLRHYRRHGPRRFALAQLQHIQRQLAKHGDVQQFYAALSILIRRIALAVHPRVQVAGLVGEAWLTFLDQSGGQEMFSSAAGRLLLSAPYQRCGTANSMQDDPGSGGHSAARTIHSADIVKLSRIWIKRNLP